MTAGFPKANDSGLLDFFGAGLEICVFAVLGNTGTNGLFRGKAALLLKPDERGVDTILPSPANRLYFGDCLDVLREDIADESVDLIYLDPPFNSKRLYNAFLDGTQWVAFDDTWRWSEAVDDFHEVAAEVGTAPTMEGLRHILGEGPNLAYLSYMANRLRECRRVLKPTGSIYLHCDPTMSHYLKVLMDAIFGSKQFKNEIVWSYRTGGGSKRYFRRKHDIIFLYTRKGQHTFNVQQERSYSTAAPPGFKGIKKYKDTDGRWYTMASLRDVWEINALGRTSKERTGYPTQKPRPLLERIIKASSRPGDTVLDPFCGCGTTVHAAQTLGRRWIGIDVCVAACQEIEKRLRGHFDNLWDDVEYIGMPKTRDDAKTLASLDAFRFERWAASLVDGMEANKRQRGDGGIDGRGRIPVRKGQFIDIVSQVKSGNTGPGDVQAFNGARQQAGAALGVFTCFENRVTQRMRDAAASTGRFMDTPVVQIYTVEDYFEGRKLTIPKAS